MKEILRLKQSNCKNCYKCIRHCPVKAIRFSAGQAHVVEEECILCGQCFAACPQNANACQAQTEAPAARKKLGAGGMRTGFWWRSRRSFTRTSTNVPGGFLCARSWSGDTEMGQIQVLPLDLKEVMALQAQEATGSS